MAGSVTSLDTLRSFRFDELTLTTKVIDKSSSPGESHPQALTEPDVNLSAHPALIVQPQVGFHETTTQRAAVLAEPRDPASEQPDADGNEIA